MNEVTTTRTIPDIGARELANKVREIAEFFPHVIYDTSRDCVYVPTENNVLGCIVGAAYTALGVLSDGGGIIGDDGFHHHRPIHEQLFFDASDEDWCWISQVQAQQDDRASWKDAVESADIEVWGVG